MNIFNEKLKALTACVTPKGLFPASALTKILGLQPLKAVNNVLGHQLPHSTSDSIHSLDW